MLKRFLVAVLSVGLLFSSPVFAGKSYSSGGRSGGGGFSGKSSTGIGSFSGKSYSSRSSGSGSFSGKSYSGSKPSTPSYKPPSSSGKSYSSGSSSKPSTPSYKPPSSSGKSYSSGSNPPPSTTNSGKSYSSVPKQPADSGTSSRKPGSSDFNSDLSKSAKKQQSQIQYEASIKPKGAYITPKGESKPIKEDAPSVSSVRRYVTHERYVTYDNRSSTFYQGYSPAPYNDFFSPFLMGYLFSSAVNSSDRAYWAYHHRDQMDEVRYREMLAKDAELKARIEALEKQGTPRDPNYVVPGMSENPDLQYSKEFVDAAYNPVIVEQERTTSTFPMWIVIVFVAFTFLGIAAYYLFVKEF